MKKEKRAKEKGRTGRLGALLLVALAAFGLSACGAPSSYVRLPESAERAYFSEEEVKSVAVRVRRSLGLPLENDAVPKVEFSTSLPGKCTSSGCPVGMYRSGRIYILESLNLRYHEMVLAHELVHHYSRVYRLGFDEKQVIAATTEAGYPMPAYARVAGR
jgi:hypothetical protein